MMKVKVTLSLIAGVVFLAMQAADATAATPVTIPGLYNTGLDNSGHLLASGVVEPHYVLTGTVSPAYVQQYLHPVWVVPASNAQWLRPRITNGWNDPPGDYYFTMSFNLSGLDPAAVKIMGQWSSDNNAEILLNNSPTGIATPEDAFLRVVPFTISGGFLPNINTLTFHVHNVGTPDTSGPAALLVQNLQATIPEPATLVLLGMGGMAIRRRVRRV
jgi:hypothetical protein